jgi:Arc/MetJ-type ribon-helix-helix transcriptional regulator
MVRKVELKEDERIVSVRLPMEYYRALQKYADAKHLSVSDAVRFAVADWIAKDIGFKK